MFVQDPWPRKERERPSKQGGRRREENWQRSRFYLISDQLKICSQSAKESADEAQASPKLAMQMALPLHCRLIAMIPLPPPLCQIITKSFALHGAGWELGWGGGGRINICDGDDRICRSGTFGELAN